MPIALVALQFNHDLYAAVKDAMTIRRNAGKPVVLPEWQEHRSIHPEDSPAAYAQRETYGNALTIQGKFRLSDGAAGQAGVTGVPALPDRPPSTTRPHEPPPRGPRHVLGEIPPTPISFGPGGDSGWVSLPLYNVGLWEAGVGVFDIGWDWYCQFPSQTTWTYFATSRHRIYSVLALPTAPWIQSAVLTDTQLPWTEVLDYACTWARGAKSFDAAAAAITRAVYNLGPTLIEYDCSIGGVTCYADPDFDCSAFLDRLRGGAGLGGFVNCTDCATILSTFANVLGCDWSQSQMGWSFDLNAVRAIGSSVWQTACGWVAFRYHEVAWHGACGVADTVCDACLQVNGSADPTGPPYVPLQPANMLFGAIGSGQYRDRLASPAGRPNCNPLPATRQRREVV